MMGQAVVPLRGSPAERRVPTNGNGCQGLNDNERMHRLKRCLSPQIAEIIINYPNDNHLWESHRQEITVVFLRLLGFAGFAESMEPEEVMDLLRSYHAEMGKLVYQFEGTLDRFAGGGMMAFFNDPTPCEDHTKRAVCMALAMRAKINELRAGWLKKGYDLDLGVGLSTGYATLGNIGFEGLMVYGAVGKVPNLAFSLCQEAKSGQILTNLKTLSKIEDIVEVEPAVELKLRGLSRPVQAFSILGLKQHESRS
jgi:adenylate cyclase